VLYTTHNTFAWMNVQMYTRTIHIAQNMHELYNKQI